MVVISIKRSWVCFADYTA